jgi:F0F1-type ATP synthase membrane subunit b/b'
MNDTAQKGRHTAIQQLRTEVQSSLVKFEEDITEICETAIKDFAARGDEIRINVAETLMNAQQQINRRVDEAMDRMIEIEGLLPEEETGRWRWLKTRRAKLRWLFVD